MLTLRQNKAAPLTHAEMDENFSYLLNFSILTSRIGLSVAKDVLSPSWNVQTDTNIVITPYPAVLSLENFQSFPLIHNSSPTFKLFLWVDGYNGDFNAVEVFPIDDTYYPPLNFEGFVGSPQVKLIMFDTDSVSYNQFIGYGEA